MERPVSGLSIGFSYDCKEEYLAAGFSARDVMEFDSAQTIAGIAQALATLGHQVTRVGPGTELARRLVAGERWDLVFSIAEGSRGRAREAQVPALCELFGQPYVFSDPLTCALTLDKSLTKRVVRDCGLPTAPFAVVTSSPELRAVAVPAPVFLKPVAEGSSKGITARSLVSRMEDLEPVGSELLDQFRQPLMVEAYLPGREVTVGILGTDGNARVLGVMEILFTSRAEAPAYTTLNKDEYEQRVAYRLVDDENLGQVAAVSALAAYRALGCRDAGRVDLRCDTSGTPCFLEINPLPGLDPVRSDLPILARLAGRSYEWLLGEILSSALDRVGAHG